MIYFQIGFWSSIILFIMTIYLTLRNRWFNNGLLEDLYEWWDGEDFEDVDLTGTWEWFLFTLLLSLLNIIAWGLMLPLLIIIYIIINIRNKKLIKNN